MATGNISMIVGKFKCRGIRNFLDTEKFKGLDIEYLETKGFFCNEFTVRGDVAAVLYIEETLRMWAEDNGYL